MRVRPVTLADGEAIRGIYNAEVRGSTATFDLRPRSRAEQLAWVQRHLGAHAALVAVERGKVAGFGSLSAFRDRPAYSTTVEDSVYVDPAWRQRGVGRLLLEALLAAGTTAGFHTVIARVASENEASVRLHRGCGFAVVGVEREIGRKFGRWLDVTVLQHML